MYLGECSSQEARNGWVSISIRTVLAELVDWHIERRLGPQKVVEEGEREQCSDGSQHRRVAEGILEDDVDHVEGGPQGQSNKNIA